MDVVYHVVTLGRTGNAKFESLIYCYERNLSLLTWFFSILFTSGRIVYCISMAKMKERNILDISYFANEIFTTF